MGPACRRGSVPRTSRANTAGAPCLLLGVPDDRLLGLAPESQCELDLAVRANLTCGTALSLGVREVSGCQLD